MQPEQKIPGINTSNGERFELGRYNQTSGRGPLRLNGLPGRTVIRVGDALTIAAGTRQSYDVDITIGAPSQEEAAELPLSEASRIHFRAIAERLTQEHPSISTDTGIFGGMPHIKNVRLSVGDVLSKLYIYGSIQAILDDYSPDINEEQIKEAIAYAQDFLETACDPRQPR